VNSLVCFTPHPYRGGGQNQTRIKAPLGGFGGKWLKKIIVLCTVPKKIVLAKSKYLLMLYMAFIQKEPEKIFRGILNFLLNGTNLLALQN
jgi:hypothetical protein